MRPKPPDLSKAASLWSDAELFWIVKHGIRMTGMPAWGDHSDDELWVTVAFLQELVEMSPQDYAKLVAASRAQGGHHHEARNSRSPHQVRLPPARITITLPGTIIETASGWAFTRS